MDTPYKGETGSAENSGVTWYSAIDEATPDTRTVYEVGDSLGIPIIINLQESGLRISPIIAAQKATSRRSVLTTLFCFGAMLTSPKLTMKSALTTAQSAAYQFQEVNDNFDNTCNAMLYHVFSVRKDANESYTSKEMLQQDDRNKFVEAMTKEIGDHMKRKHWEMVLISQMPQGIKPIMDIWSFKMEQYPDGTLNKHKARLCAHGGHQQWGIKYWETYAPVVNWVSVRFILIISQLVGLETQALDFVLTFPQEKLDVPVYMKIPPGIDIENGSKDEYLI